MRPAIEIQHVTSYCKATADQLRLQILRILARESFGVLELCHIVEAAQPALSHHLKVLANADLVETRRQGTSIYYRRALIPTEDPIHDLRQSLFDSIDEIELPKVMLKGIRDVYQERNSQAKIFFQKNADRLRGNQDLIAEYTHYEECIDNLLNNEALNSKTSVLEIGPGDSDLLLNLGKRFNKVTALDNTSEMLDKTRSKFALSNTSTRSNKDTNIAFFLGELREFTETVDMIVLNMVLHHLPSPANFFKEASTFLNDSGRVLVADLCAHDQDWTKDACGDLWLGFDPAELDDWANNAGFTQGQSAYLGLNNGFQVQVRLFSKTQHNLK